jgi:hypothetical protein
MPLWRAGREVWKTHGAACVPRRPQRTLTGSAPIPSVKIFDVSNISADWRVKWRRESAAPGTRKIFLEASRWGAPVPPGMTGGVAWTVLIAMIGNGLIVHRRSKTLAAVCARPRFQSSRVGRICFLSSRQICREPLHARCIGHLVLRRRGVLKGDPLNRHLWINILILEISFCQALVQAYGLLHDSDGMLHVGFTGCSANLEDPDGTSWTFRRRDARIGTLLKYTDVATPDTTEKTSCEHRDSNHRFSGGAGGGVHQHGRDELARVVLVAHRVRRRGWIRGYHSSSREIRIDHLRQEQGDGRIALVKIPRASPRAACVPAGGRAPGAPGISIIGASRHAVVLIFNIRAI